MTPGLLIAGPTASGKSALALAAAQALGGEIVNADSMQIYDGLHIVTARPDVAEEAQVPHHLFGCVDPAERWSVGSWTDAALRVMADIRQRGRVPILVGGTGLYFAALTHGLAPIPEIGAAARERATALLRSSGPEALHREAVALDPVAAERVEPGDRQRLLRIVEVGYQTGQPISAFREQTEPLLPPGSWRGVVIDPDRDALYRRIDARFDRMLEMGALEEIRGFMARRLDADLPAMKALGVPPLIAHLRGELPLDEAVEAAKRETRRYAKRQLTWIRNQMTDWPRIHTLEPEAARQDLLALLGEDGVSGGRGAPKSQEIRPHD